MSKTITKPELLELLAKNKASLEALTNEKETFEKEHEKHAQDYNRRWGEMQQDCQRFVELMNDEYGWGNWQNVDANTQTFLTREEFCKDFYILPNPALREKITPQDVDLKINAGIMQEFDDNPLDGDTIHAIEARESPESRITEH